MSGLTDAVRTGRTDEVVRLLDGMTDAERRAAFPELKQLRKELRPRRWESDAVRAYPALHLAGAACQTGAAGVASWIAAADLQWSSSSRSDLLLHVLGDRDPAWLAEVTRRLAERPAASRVSHELMAGLVRLSGHPVPTTDAYVRGWVERIGSTCYRGDTVLEQLRRDPHLVRLVAALFETDDIGSRMQWGAAEGPNSWTDAIARLTVEGALDRTATVDACVARLLRGGTAADHRVFLRLLKTLALTGDEQRERTADWLALASDAVSVVAAHAQSVLGALAAEGELSPRRLSEMSAAVLFRTEKKLVRAQLVLLGKVLARDASTAGELLPVVAQAFGYDDPDVQERALKLAERHLGKVTSAEVRAEVADAAAALIPILRTRAVGSLGAAPGAGDAAASPDVLPPVPVPLRLAPAPGSAVELAEELGAVLASSGDVAAFERALDGLVRHVHSDREGLLEALAPVTARRWWNDAHPDHEYHQPAEHYYGASFHSLHDAEDALDLVLATLAGHCTTARLHRAVVQGARERSCPHSALARAFEARVWEVAYRIRTDPLPFLLSTPTWSTGLLEPDELVERLDAYQRLGARPAAADFAQALLRVRRADRVAAAAAAARAAALGTPEGTRLAAWLVSEAPSLPSRRRRTSGPRVLIESAELLELQEDFPAEFTPLGRPVGVFDGRRYCQHWSDELRPHWLALLPERRELVAVRVLLDLSRVSVDDTRGVGFLPLLAESGGEAGEAVHLCLAYGLGARHAEDRLAAVDALLVLAARGELDAARLGADLAELVRGAAVKPQRLADSLRTAAATGANATIWGLLGRALPPLLADLPTAGTAGRGLGELLTVASECAERSGARGDLPHLAQAAARRGSSRLVTQARRLRSALTEGVAA
ncbi:hypothetical protein FNH09_10880 [Streptomyces adustus]|uniref:DUF7824 domain-containing protein n=1 Tax=Streptomyces adustus TaxID=1609272 RepID=A0A5N8VAV2_9ACTN|nr:DUF6493 family protein [Streptomyces adustus]MPY31772.1 hypothetical protein [Streptomyces adustus]